MFVSQAKILCRLKLRKSSFLCELENFLVLQKVLIDHYDGLYIKYTCIFKNRCQWRNKMKSVLKASGNIQLHQMMEELDGQTSFSTFSVSMKQNQLPQVLWSQKILWQKMSWNMKVSSCLSLFNNVAETSQGNNLYGHIIFWVLKLDFRQVLINLIKFIWLISSPAKTTLILQLTQMGLP